MQIDQLAQQPTHFLKEKLSFKALLISVFSIQMIFQCNALLINQLLIQTDILKGSVNTNGLVSFASDTWLLTLIVMVVITMVHRVKSIQNFSIILLISFPVFLFISSLTRLVSTWLILPLLLIAGSIVIKTVLTINEKKHQE